jgi:aspartate racemase
MTSDASGIEALCVDSTAPENVRQVDTSLHRREIWHVISRNSPVRGCVEAARQRRRLGQVGIPLCDELKSLVCVAVSSPSVVRYVILHARGHQTFDLDKVRGLLGVSVQRLPSPDLFHEFDLEYGTVHPMAFGSRSDVVQVVDDTVLQPFYPPHTLMTNAGDLRYGLEFRAELFQAMQNVRIGDVVGDINKHVPAVRTLGIVTGNSPESGMLLWERINARIRQDTRAHFKGDLDFPRIMMRSVPDLGASMELGLREPDVRASVMDAVKGLCQDGAEVIGIACNTTQYLADEASELCAGFGATFVSLGAETRAYLQQHEVDGIFLLGIEAVTDLTGVTAFAAALSGFQVTVPTPYQLEIITDLAYLVKTAVVTSAAINRFRDLMSTVPASETVLIALTEVSVLLSERTNLRRERRIIDTMDILADRMAATYLSDRVKAGAT